MDVERIFASLPEWSRELTDDQKALLARLMAVKNSRGFVGFNPDDARALGAQLLKGEEAEARIDELRHAIESLKPARADTDFI